MSSIGIHVEKKNHESIEGAVREFCADNKTNVCQIFTHGPHGKNESKGLVKSTFKKYIASQKKRVYVHSTYRTSWKDKGRKHITDQIEMCDAIGAKGLVIHIANKSPTEVVEDVVDFVSVAKSTKILLEMRAMKVSATTYESPSKLNVLISKLIDAKITPKQCGIVIDTAHIYTGKQKIRTYQEGVKYLDAIKNKKYVQLLHLNGNLKDCELYSKDEHIVPFHEDDKIWGGVKWEDSGCQAFIHWFLDEGLDIVLELKMHNPGVPEFLKKAQGEQ
jgi:endonuclease IV